MAQITLAREVAEHGQLRVPRRILAFTNVVVARYEAPRQIHHLVQALGFDQIVFLCRAIERDVAGMQHEIGADVCNVLGRREEIGHEIGLVAAQVRVRNGRNAESHAGLASDPT